MTTLHRETRALHHAVEHTALGQAIASGNPTKEQYALWLAMNMPVATFCAALVPSSLRSVEGYLQDVEALGVPWSPPSPVVRHVAAAHTSEIMTMGTLYVYLGALLKGGPILAERLKPNGFPVAHFAVSDEGRDAGERILRDLRRRTELVPGAMACFSAFLAVAEDAAQGRRDP